MKEDGIRNKLHGRHTSQFRLTDLGRNQAKRAGLIVREHIGAFDKMYCSEYTRAVETAGFMDLPESNFHTEVLIRERDSMQKGSIHPAKDYTEKCKELCEGSGWFIPNAGGESFANVTERLLLFLRHLQDTAAGLRVLVVCHAHVIRAFKAILEDMKAPDYDDLLNWKIPNCHVRWYTRREVTGNVHARIWKVISLNMEDSLSRDRCDATCEVEDYTIKRQLLNAEQLRSRAMCTPQVLNNEEAEQEGIPEKKAKIIPQ